MTNTHPLALLSLMAALLLGILGDQLILGANGFGLGATLWVGGIALAPLALVHWRKSTEGIQTLPPLPATPEGLTESPTLTGEGRWLLPTAFLFSLGLLWRASPMLQFLDVLAIGICLGLAALTLRREEPNQPGPLSRTGVLSLPLGLLLSAAHHISGPFLLLLSDIKWTALPKGKGSKQVAAVIRGLLIALPLLLLFGGLFAAADAIFAGMVESLFTFNIDEYVAHLFGVIFFGGLAAGFLRTSLLRRSEALPEMPPASGFTLGPIETGLILGLLNLLFLAFVLVQLPYLFGGAALVQSGDLTYAEYARRGFFELVQVSALLLPILLALHWLIPATQQLGHRLFRILGTSLVALLFLIMASAVQRMWLYQQEFGLTELRLYTTAFMGWMALLFVGLLLTLFRGQRERFALWALSTGLLVLSILHLINPDALILRTNLAHLERSGRFDIPYAASLSPDALPALVTALPTLLEQEPAAIVTPSGETEPFDLLTELKLRRDGLEQQDWRAWNWGKAQARKALRTLEP